MSESNRITEHIVSRNYYCRRHVSARIVVILCLSLCECGVGELVKWRSSPNPIQNFIPYFPLHTRCLYSEEDSSQASLVNLSMTVYTPLSIFWRIEKIEQASNELVAVSQLYNAYVNRHGYQLMNRIQGSCYSKCINKKFYEGDLTTGEAVCLDRCVSKFFATHQKMNEVLSSWHFLTTQGINEDQCTERRTIVAHTSMVFRDPGHAIPDTCVHIYNLIQVTLPEICGNPSLALITTIARSREIYPFIHPL